jgi:hypothetical protein
MIKVPAVVINDYHHLVVFTHDSLSCCFQPVCFLSCENSFPFLQADFIVGLSFFIHC